MSDKTIGQMILRRISESPKTVAVRAKVNGTYADTTYATLGKRMEAIASGLLTALDDVPHHAAVAVLGNTSEDWIACDFAALSVGLRTVPVYATLLPEEAGYMHVDTGCIISIVEDAAQLAKVRELRNGFTFFDKKYDASEVKLQHIIVMNPEGIAPADDWESLADVEKRGTEKLAETADERTKRGEGLTREDTCTYTYTSGTTGPPKAVIQTNENMLSFLENIGTTAIFTDDLHDSGLFLFLPLAHSFGRLIELGGPFFDAPIVISAVPTLVDDLNATNPGFFPAAPRVFEKMKARIEGKVAGAPPIRQRLFHAAVAAGKATIPYRSTGRPVPFLTNLKFRIADRIVLSKLRGALGFERAKVLLSGSAPLNVEVQEFFMAMGLDLLEAYGLTETCPGLTANLPGRIRVGTVGPALPGVTIRIAADGEIEAKGPNITPGYLNRDEATAAAFNDEGWFLTGDLGSVDQDGFVKITGRKKELMKTSGGKYIAPAKLEGRLKNLTIVQEAVTVADLRNFVTVIIAIDTEELETWAEQKGVPADPNGEAVANAVQAHIDAVNETLAKYETIKYFTIVEPMTTDNGLLTASFKVKRKVVYDRYADEIEAMYTKKKPGT
ncbi:MAG: AMP-binding protein [Proteobacteria bacterium]|nr:AMP-binding protein [Pseudomonadota bacterium]